MCPEGGLRDWEQLFLRKRDFVVCVPELRRGSETVVQECHLRIQLLLLPVQFPEGRGEEPAEDCEEDRECEDEERELGAPFPQPGEPFGKQSDV